MCRALYYDVDEDGGVVSNAKGKRFISCMRELMGVYFPDDILTHWRRQPDSSKDAVLDALHREFPNPMDDRFRKQRNAISHEPSFEVQAWFGKNGRLPW